MRMAGRGFQKSSVAMQPFWKTPECPLNLCEILAREAMAVRDACDAQAAETTWAFMLSALQPSQGSAMPLWFETFLRRTGDVSAALAGAMPWNSANVPSLFSPPRASQGAVARERERGKHVNFPQAVLWIHVRPSCTTLTAFHSELLGHIQHIMLVSIFPCSLREASASEQ